MLEVHGLSHAYGRHKALDDVSIRLRAGEAVAILGANGAGKTTLLNSIAGLVRPTAGSIRFEGRELVGLSPHRIVEMGIATVPENRHGGDPHLDDAMGRQAHKLAALEADRARGRTHQ